MSGYIESWNTLETYGNKGNAFKNRKDYLTPTGRLALKYASLAGVVLSLFSIGVVLF